LTPSFSLDNPEMKKRLERVLVRPDLPISEAVDVLDKGGVGLLIIVDEDRKLLGVMTDGDHRRAILRHVRPDEPCINIATRNPVVGSTGMSPSEALDVMDHSRGFLVNQITLVNDDGTVAGLVLRSDLITSDETSVSAMVMAGGFGVRLRPLTEHTPKPMLPVDGKPVMEHLLNHLKQAGIRRINVTTHYRPEKITDYFGDGKAMGLDIKYVPEERPLGTGGALGLLGPSNEPLLVVNGDVLTGIDFSAMIDFHREHAAEMTVAVRRFDVPVPFGVIDSEHGYATKISEKPTLNFFVNAGIYLLQPTVQNLITPGEAFDMTDLIDRLLQAKRPVATFPMREYWLDIGKHADYERAQQEYTGAGGGVAE
jgi:dTDP-glucose pyrophosphorylase/CBS domain-containing protein